MLTKRELLEAAIARRPVERMPVALWRHWPMEDQDAEALARATLDFQARFDFDLIKVTPSQNFVGEDYGLSGHYDGNPEGDLVKGPRPITSLEQWEALRPLPLDTGAPARQLRCLELIGAGAGETPFIQTIFDPLTVAWVLAGEQAAVWRRREPELFQRGYNAIIDTWCGFIAGVMARGAAGIFYSVAQASYRTMSEEEYRRWGRPADLALLDAARDGWLNLLHVHGYDLMFAEVAGYPCQIVNWDDRRAGPALAAAQGLVKGAVAGGINQWQTLLSGRPDQVYAEVADAVAQTGGLGYVVAAGCVTPIPAAESNLRAAAEAARSHASR